MDLSNIPHAEIHERLEEFRERKHGLRDPLVFCLCTPQTNAHKGWNAATTIMSDELYRTIDIEAVLFMSGVRFHKTKAVRIKKALDRFPTESSLSEHLAKLQARGRTTIEFRNLLAKSIEGFGLKEASHYLRNIGFYDYICILDRHIMRRLADHGVIENPKIKLGKKAYLEIEQKMIDFSIKNKIRPGELDLIFWWQSKGEIFR